MATATLFQPSRNMPSHPPQPAGNALPSALSAAFDRIVLTGFMGSGKTTVGALLAPRLGWRFLDLDREIERRDGRSVPEIFAARGATGGEPHFRRLETSALASALGRRNIVLALGGGAPETLANRLLLEQTPRTAVVYLDAPLPTLLGRCATQATDPASATRPVLTDIALAERRFHLRRPHYRRIASHTVDTSTQTPAQTADALLHLLQPLR